jgi:PIN domain nuclease of toxin-antitoxin system
MILLDTHYLIWSMCDPDKLSTKARNLIATSEDSIFFSSASIFEIEIKKSIGKLVLDDGFLGALIDAGFLELPIHANHAENIRNLPLIHKDPFDRMLLSQAQCEKMTLLSCDAQIHKYKSYYSKIRKV